jgi:hypothetical protein
VSMEICIHRSSCAFYTWADRKASYRVLKSAYCEHAPDRCELNRRYLAHLPVPHNLLPDGTMEI